MTVDLLPFEGFSGLVFRGAPGTNPVCLADLWRREVDRFLADPADPEGAILYRRGDWWHALYNRPEAFAGLLATLPAEPEPRFAAFPPHQWPRSARLARAVLQRRDHPGVRAPDSRQGTPESRCGRWKRRRPRS